jgi:thioredoxin 1
MNNTTDATFYKDVIEKSGLILVKFEADWCGPCKAMIPTLEDLEKDYSGKMEIVKVDIDKEQETATLYGIKSIPTLLLFKAGVVVGKMVGAAPKNTLASFIDKNK